ncbi:hypothetical protein GF376_00235 [Candidatus Peregrinibacteria bacterium]|nr:hypothetical protein [Candidatus Peregrinibacteria bacterium]
MHFSVNYWSIGQERTQLTINFQSIITIQNSDNTHFINRFFILMTLHIGIQNQIIRIKFHPIKACIISKNIRTIR